MLLWLKKAWSWLGMNGKWVLLIAGSALLAIIGVGWYRNKRKIEKLKNEVYILQAKLKIEKLAVRHDVMIEDLNELKEKEGPIKEELTKIEKKLNEKVPDMTIEELAKRFQKIK